MLALMVVLAGAVGWSTVLASAPSVGSPTPISTYGTVVLGTSFTPSGSQFFTNVYVFSTVGPFYVQKLNVEVSNGVGGTATSPVDLSSILYDGGALAWNANCETIIPSTASGSNSAGDIIPLANSTLTDPSGARAISAANEIEFTLSYGCLGAAFPSALTINFETTILAPASATLSVCANEGLIPLAACPVTTRTAT